MSSRPPPPRSERAPLSQRGPLSRVAPLQQRAPLPIQHDDEAATPDGRPFFDQPKWRRDFPVDWDRDEYVSRRDLVKFMVLTSAAFAVGQCWLAIKNVLRGAEKSALPESPIAQVDELAVGGAKTFTYPEGSTPRLLVRKGHEDFVAYDQQCTHLLCPVLPDVEHNRLRCPCHNAAFDLDSGRPIAGPPQRALPRVQLKVVAGTVYATGIEDPA